MQASAGCSSLCFLGALTHPLLDLLTTYGIRLLSPFSHRWFYGDTLFIMDPWIWLMLILGLEMSWRAERLGRDWTRPAMWAFGAMLGYIGFNLDDQLRAVDGHAAAGRARSRAAPDRRRSAVPLTFWKRRHGVAQRRDRRRRRLRSARRPEPRTARPGDRAAATSTTRASPPPRSATSMSAPSCSGRACRWSSSRTAAPF